MIDPFPSSMFDQWADSYDQDTLSQAYPFTGYQQALDTVVRLAEPFPRMTVLDVGTGTGNLARRFLEQGCRVAATDFSPAMLARARQNLPEITFIQADLRQPLPPELIQQKFNRIVSAYVFHHFPLPEKLSILKRLSSLLAPGGWLVIADIAFGDEQEQEAVRKAVGEAWEQEFYWIARETIPALKANGFSAHYTQVSPCAGVYRIALDPE